MNQDIHQGQVPRNITGENQPDKAEVVGEPQRIDCGLESLAPGTVSNKKKSGVRTPGDDGWGDFEKVIMAFERE